MSHYTTCSSSLAMPPHVGRIEKYKGYSGVYVCTDTYPAVLQRQTDTEEGGKWTTQRLA